jgi:peptidoglycan/xylan/chitin deacetylase (PgdA/CDA1 family)
MKILLSFILLLPLFLQTANAQTPNLVVLTFDDDWIGQYKYAIPTLEKNGFNATFFVTCLGPIQQAPSFIRGMSPDITTWDQVKAIKDKGFDIQNHGMTHHNLTAVNTRILNNEVVKSKQCLDKHLGVNASIFATAYAGPVGNKTVDSLISANYDFARNGYGMGHYSSPRYALPTDNMNQLDRDNNHNTTAIMKKFATELISTSILSEAMQGKDALIPVLVYHNIAPLNATDKDWKNSTTTPETFNAQMAWLKDKGFTVIPIRALQYTNGFDVK